FRELEGGLEDFAVARAMRHDILGHNNHFITVLRLVLLKLLVGTGEQIITALKLGLGEKDAAVGVGRRAKLQLEREVLREFASRPNLGDLAPFRRRRHDQAAVLGEVATVTASRLAVEGFFLLQSPLIAKAPAGQVAAVEEADESHFGL